VTVNNIVTLKRRGYSRSSKMASFVRLHTSSYSSSIVTMGVFCIVFEIKGDIG